MNSPRVILVTQRFWPLTGPAELATAELAIGLRERGLPVVVLTSLWNRHWPPEVDFHEMMVHRLEQPPRGHWATWRYQRAISNWLRRHASEGDLVCVCGMAEEAYAVMGAVGRKTPVVITAQGSSTSSEPPDAPASNWPKRVLTRSRQAAAIVASCQASASPLIAAGHSAELIRVIPPGVEPSPPRTRERQADTLAMLTEVSRQFELPPLAPLIVLPGTLDESFPAAELVSAWPLVLRQYPTAQLCVLGIGAARKELIRQVRHLGLSDHIMLPGGIDHLEEVFAAADLAMLPHVAAAPTLLIQVMAAGLPAVVARDAVAEELLGETPGALLVKPDSTETMLHGVLQLLDDPTSASLRGQAGQALVARHYSRESMLDQYVELFRGLCEAEIC